MTDITICLWFDGQAEQAAQFYASVFDDATVGDISRYGDTGPGEAGAVMTASFELGGQSYVGLNGGPMYQFTEAISLQVHCDTQAEVDRYWAALTADGGEESQCGWCKDKFGLSWQIVPRPMMELLQDPDPGRSNRAMQAMLGMKKIDVDAIRAAADAG